MMTGSFVVVVVVTDQGGELEVRGGAPTPDQQGARGAHRGSSGKDGDVRGETGAHIYAQGQGQSVCVKVKVSQCVKDKVSQCVKVKVSQCVKVKVSQCVKVKVSQCV